MLRSSANALKVLLVEDDPAWQHLIAVGLGGRGIDVAIADDVAKACANFDRVAPDAVLLDDGLPDSNSEDATRKLRQKVGDRQIPIVLLSGKRQAEALSRALQAGATDVFVKSKQWTQLSEQLLKLVHDLRSPKPRSEAQMLLERAREMARNVQERARAGVQVQNQKDTLTGLLNRAAWMQQLDQRLAADFAAGQMCAVLLFDIDKFRNLNRVLGPAAGDATLLEFARRLKGAYSGEDTGSDLDSGGNDSPWSRATTTVVGEDGRESMMRDEEAERAQALAGAAEAARLKSMKDHVMGRVGGDEFAVLFRAPESMARVDDFVERGLRVLRRSIRLSELTLSMSASVGVVVAPEHGRTPELLMRQARAALNMARRQGGNVGVLFNPLFIAEDEADPAVPEHEMSAGLQSAVDRNELVLHYQPVVDAHTGEAGGVEALLRWMRGGQMISPRSFVSVAEEVGALQRMGEWAVSEALQQMRRWQMAGVVVPQVSVNVAARHVVHPAFARAVQGALAATQLPPSTLTLELSERDLMQDFETGKKACAIAHDLGLRVALDDFGPGFSSLNYLVQLQADVLKIDESLVRSMMQDPQTLAVVRAIIAIGTVLNMQVIAEGVETREELEMLQQMQCPTMQGYYFARPLPAVDLEGWWSNAILEQQGLRPVPSTPTGNEKSFLV